MENNKKRLLMCYHSSDYGGVEQQICDIISGLSDQLKIYVVCPDGPLVKEYLDAGAIEHINLTPKFEADISYSNKIRKIIQDFNIDIVHSHELKAGSLATFGAWLAGSKKRVYHVHTPFSEWKYNSSKAYPALIINTIVNAIVGNVFATDVLALTESVKKTRIKKEFIRPSKITVIPNGIDVEGIKNSSNIRDNLGFSKTDYVIGNLARFTEEKGHSRLINGFNNLLNVESEILGSTDYNSFKLLLAGGGKLLEDMKNEVERLNIKDRVIFTGKFRDEDKYKLLKSIDLFVYPTYAEGFGITIVEALAAELPVVASDLSVIRDVCGTDVLYFHNEDISKELIEFTKQIINDKSFKVQLQEKANNRASNYTLEKFWINYRNLYLS